MFITAEVFRVAKEDVSHLAFNWGRVTEKFLHADPKDRSRRIHRVRDQRSL
jgi:hypothetical protein